MYYHTILRDYARNYAIPAMLEQGWAFKAAKSYGWLQAKRGPEYHVDQPLRSHILNGLYALTRVLEYLKTQGYYSLSAHDFKRVLVLYTLHDAYKDSALASTKMGKGEFGIPLTALEDLLDRMHLRDFVNVTAAEVRMASVSLQSPRVGDLAASSPGFDRLSNLIHLADAFASQQTSRDYRTAEHRIQEMISGPALTAHTVARVGKRMSGIDSVASEVQPALKLYYHELDDYRGLSTLLIHQATEEVLSAYGFYPLLYFANGNLYIGPEHIEIDTAQVREKVAKLLLLKIRNEANESLDIARDACDPRKGMKIEKYAYLFCSFAMLLKAVQEKTTLSKTVGFMSKILAERVKKQKYERPEDFYLSYDMPMNLDQTEMQAQHWLAASKLIMAAENMAGALVPTDTLEWLFMTFHTPTQIAETIRQQHKLLTDGGVSDHSFIIAYHWLAQARFTEQKRIWLEVEVSHIQETLTAQILQALQQYEQADNVLNFVEKELALQSDSQQYLAAHLQFSFETISTLEESSLAEYEKERKPAHKRICSICNRVIIPQVNKKNSEIKTTIANQQALVFSNKRRPTDINKSDMMVWCPMCYLEFMVRKLSGQSYPDNSDYNASYRLHLYVLPDYSFTPQLWEDTSRELMRNFHPQETTASRLVLRGSKDEPALPAQWLERRTVDPSWLEHVQDMFANQAAYIQTPTKDGKKRSKFGDRMTFSFKNPNYMLITYDNTVQRNGDKSLAPTHVEVWTKALYAATLIHLLTGARIYITDKPYLTITRPEQMKTIIEMEGLHPLLYSLLPLHRTDAEFAAAAGIRASESNARLPIAALPTMLDLLAAVWEINAALYQSKPNERRNLDKQVASILEEIRRNYLAGATLYKMRERSKGTAYAIFTRACQLLLPLQHDEVRQALYDEGYELMLDKEGGDLMKLAHTITDTSLKLYHPSAKEKGRTHRFETLFRTGVEAIKINANVHEDELIARVAGTVLKRLERIIDAGGYSPIYGEERLATVQAFAETLVRDLFCEHCGRSVSRLSHEENPLADAIYFLTYQKINQYWAEKRSQEGKTEEASVNEEND